MRKLFCLGTCILCTFLYSTTNAQRYYGQWTLSISGGYGNTGGNIHCTGEKYIGRTLSGIKLGFEYTRNKCPELEFRLPVNRFLLHASYFYSFEKYMGEYLFLNLGSGVFVGSENIGNVKLPYGVIAQKSKFCYGLTITPQMELLFRRGSNISGFILPLIGYDFNSRFTHLIYSGNIGIKYYF